MAYYNYKVVRDLIPDHFWDRYIHEFEKKTGKEFDHDANYDGHLWLMTAEYIEFLQARTSLNKWFTDGPKHY